MKLCKIALELSFVFEADGSLSSKLHGNLLVFPYTQINLQEEMHQVAKQTMQNVDRMKRNTATNPNEKNCVNKLMHGELHQGDLNLVQIQ